MGECYRDLFRNIIPFDTCYIDQSKIWGYVVAANLHCDIDKTNKSM